MSHQTKKFISIEGNIGSGKSTVLKIIRDNFKDLVILDEPLSSWEKVGENQDCNLLGLYYKNPQRWGFTFQTYAFMTRLQKWTQFTKMDDLQTKISERSLLSDRYIFASIMRDMNILNEAQYQIYLHMYEEMTKIKKIADIQGILYVKCDPNTCSQRIKKRARTGQSQIPLDYLQKLHDKHEEWLNSPKRAYSDQNETCKSSRSGTSSEQEHSSEQFEQNSFESPKSEKNESDKQNPQRYSLFSSNKNSQKKPRSICSFNPHTRPNPLNFNINTNDSLRNSQFRSQTLTNKSQTQQKVLIIDNSQPLNKQYLIRQINNWIKSVFPDYQNQCQ